MRHLLVPSFVLLLVGLVPVAAAEPVEVDVGILLVNVGNYDTNRGTYTVDMYLWMRWDPATAPEGFTPDRFEFMNGRAASKERIFDGVDNETGRHETWWRIQANLYSEPRFEDFPFDTQRIEVLLEDSVRTSAELVYAPIEAESGLEEEFRLPGWRVGAPVLEVGTKTYRFGEEYARLRLEVSLERERLSTGIKTLLPPLAFVIVSGLSFFLHPSKVANRLGLGTSMVISAVMFHISQTVSLPPMGRLILFDKIMLAVYAFLVGSLLVTALISIDEDWWKDRDHTRAINVYGFVLTLVLPVVLFLALLWL